MPKLPNDKFPLSYLAYTKLKAWSSWSSPCHTKLMQFIGLFSARKMRVQALHLMRRFIISSRVDAQIIIFARFDWETMVSSCFFYDFPRVSNKNIPDRCTSFRRWPSATLWAVHHRRMFRLEVPDTKFWADGPMVWKLLVVVFFEICVYI